LNNAAFWGYLIGVMLDPILWVVALSLGFLIKEWSVTPFKWIVITIAVITVKLLLTPQYDLPVSDSYTQLLWIASTIAAFCYGGISLLIFKPAPPFQGTQGTQPNGESRTDETRGEISLLSPGKDNIMRSTQLDPSVSQSLTNVEDQLRKLIDLHAKGLLSDQELILVKQRVLENL
jgi:hypothetical protein